MKIISNLDKKCKEYKNWQRVNDWEYWRVKKEVMELELDIVRGIYNKLKRHVHIYIRINIVSCYVD